MTLDEARLLASVIERAARLFEDGYQARWSDEYVLEITNDEGTTYAVDTLFETCTCPFYTRWAARYACCKHVLGYKRLLDAQEAHAEAERKRAWQTQLPSVTTPDATESDATATVTDTAPERRTPHGQPIPPLHHLWA